jgi:hypothetical protein
MLWSRGFTVDAVADLIRAKLASTVIERGRKFSRSSL